MDAALVLVLPRPAAGAIVLARLDAAGARHAADAGIAVIHQRMVGQLVPLREGFQLVLIPIPQRIEPEAALEIFHRFHHGARAGLETLTAGDLGLERL